jgi:small-conductance mechanosensitive channel/CRP-like cAMP-binding protein
VFAPDPHAVAPQLHLAIGRVDVSWVALAVALGMALLLLVVRRLTHLREHKTGVAAVALLLLSFGLRVGTLLTEHLWPEVAEVLRFSSAILLTAGMSAAIGVLLFSALLERIGVYVPTILRGMLIALGFVIGVFALLRLRGADLFSLVTTSAVLTAVIGLSLQQPIANMFAGLSLQLDRTMRPGDWISVGEREGRIQYVSFRSTTLLTREGNMIYLPNRELIQAYVTNYTRPEPRWRSYVEVGFHYRHAPNEVRQALLDAVIGTPGVLAEPVPEVIVSSFAESAVRYQILFWLSDYMRRPQIEGEVNTRVWYAAQRAKLEIPFPMRNVLIHKGSEDGAADRALAERRRSLGRIELFSVLEPEDRDDLASRLHRHDFARGETIIEQGKPGDSLYLIAAGEVAVLLRAESSERKIATLHAGDFLGEASLLTGEPRSATCVAESDVVCHVVTHAVLEELLRRKPVLAERLSQALTLRQSELEAGREGLSAEALRSRREQTGKLLLDRIRAFFKL